MPTRTYRDADLLALLRTWAQDHGRPPSARDFTGSAPSSVTYIRRFGSWSGALRAAGLTPPPSTRRTRKAACRDAFQSYAATATGSLSVAGYRAWARSAPNRPSLATLYRYWGSWNDLLRQLPDTTVQPQHRAMLDHLLVDLRRCAAVLEHWPTAAQYDAWAHRERARQGGHRPRLSRSLRHYGRWPVLIQLAGGPVATPRPSPPLPPPPDLLEALAVWQRTTHWQLFPLPQDWPTGRRAVPGLPAWRVYRRVFGSWEQLFVAYDAWRYRRTR